MSPPLHNPLPFSKTYGIGLAGADVERSVAQGQLGQAGAQRRRHKELAVQEQLPQRRPLLLGGFWEERGGEEDGVSGVSPSPLPSLPLPSIPKVV